jgi:hypothetical protein
LPVRTRFPDNDGCLREFIAILISDDRDVSRVVQQFGWGFLRTTIHADFRWLVGNKLRL